MSDADRENMRRCGMGDSSGIEDWSGMDWWKKLQEEEERKRIALNNRPLVVRYLENLNKRLSDTVSNIDALRLKIKELSTFDLPGGFNNLMGKPEAFFIRYQRGQEELRQRFKNRNIPLISDVEKQIVELEKIQKQYESKILDVEKNGVPSFLSREERNDLSGLGTIGTKTWVYMGKEKEQDAWAKGDKYARDLYKLVDSNREANEYVDQKRMLPTNVNLVKTEEKTDDEVITADTAGYKLNPEWEKWNKEAKTGATEPVKVVLDPEYVPPGKEINPAWTKWYKDVYGSSGGYMKKNKINVPNLWTSYNDTLGGVGAAVLGQDESVEPPRWGVFDVSKEARMGGLNTAVNSGVFVPDASSSPDMISTATDEWVSFDEYDKLTDEEKKELGNVGIAAFNVSHSKNLVNTKLQQDQSTKDRDLLWNLFYDASSAKTVEGKREDFWNLLGENYYTNKIKYGGGLDEIMKGQSGGEEKLVPITTIGTQSSSGLTDPFTPIVSLGIVNSTTTSDKEEIEKRNIESKKELTTYINSGYENVHRPWVMQPKIDNILSGNLTAETTIVPVDETVIGSAGFNIRPWIKKKDHKTKYHSVKKLRGKNISC